MKPFQILTIIMGCTGVALHLSGILLEYEYLNFIATVVGRLAAILYVVALDKFRLYSVIPLICGLMSLVTHERYWMYLEFSTQASLYQIIAYITFTKLNQNEKDTIGTN